MPINRDAAIDYARKHWNRVTDDDKFWTSDEEISVAAKRRSMNAPASEGWDVFFVSNGDDGENAVFRRTVNGSVEEKPSPVATWDQLDDCTHYVSRCLIREGIALTETPRANELALAMINSAKAKTLALKTTQEEGQKIIDSGAFKPGDLVAYFTPSKDRYTHTAMFVGKQTDDPSDPGGITCHTVCRFEGLTKAWNGATDDGWFLDVGELAYTLIHFSDDDPAIAVATREWLPGWWQTGNDFYFVRDDGHAFATNTRPTKASSTLQTGTSVGYYFERDGDVVFVWRKPGSKAQVERWTAPSGIQQATLEIDGARADLTRLFQTLV